MPGVKRLGKYLAMRIGHCSGENAVFGNGLDDCPA